MSEFKREVRYTVIKHNQLTESQMQYLKNCIFGEGIPTVEAVVVESDWPEYQPVWKMIEDRVSGAPVDGGKAEYDALAQSMTTNQTIDGVPRVLVEWMANAGDLVEMLGLCSGELRALLDAPAIKPADDWENTFGPDYEHDDLPGSLPKAVSFLPRRDGYCQCGRLVDRPPVRAVPPQGEPVAWVVFDNGFIDDHTVVKTVADEWAERGLKVTPLYAEQPAPVAVPRLEMAHVVRAHMEIPGCPVLTSNQCHALAMKLNESLKPSL